MSKRRTAAVPETADQHQRELIRLIQAFQHTHDPYSVFSDFVEMSALAISNAVDQGQYEAREERYLAIARKYTREELDRFARMLAALTMSLELRQAMLDFTDVLGEVFMQLDINNTRAGQFFTPYPVSRLMAGLSIGDGGSAVREHGFLRLQEPACGAGSMVIAAAESLARAGHNYQHAMHATAIDIDARCVHMAYLQLSLLHIPAVVVHGNALSLEVWGIWKTPAHVMGAWDWRLRRHLADTPVPRESAAAAEVPAEVQTATVIEGTEPEALKTETLLADDVAVAVANLTLDSDLADLFEVALAKSQGSIFEKVDQMLLF